MHRIHRAARSVSCDRGEKCGIEDSEADFLAFHVSIRDGNTEVVMNRIAV
jgi:hypothetical protein